jgi:hypothetical protein
MIVNGFEFICGINKTVMYKDKFVFAQLPRFLDRNHSNNLIKKYEGGKYIKSYTFFVISYLQWCLINYPIKGASEIRTCLWKLMPENFTISKSGKSVTRSNLSKDNAQRDYRIFEEYATFMIAEARKRRINKIFELDGHVYVFDSTTIDLCLTVF